MGVETEVAAMAHKEKAAGDGGGAGESSTNNSQHLAHCTAQSTLAELSCGRHGCPCAASERKGQGLTHCPAHDDKTPSMNVAENNGKLLVRCHAGCEPAAVIAALDSSSSVRASDRRSPPFAPRATASGFL